MIRAWLPQAQILEEHSICGHPSTGQEITVDVFLPEHNIAFEYQGEHHYHEVTSNTLPTTIFEARDIEKLSICKQYGIDVVQVPYWWRGDIKDLVENISSGQPRAIDLVPLLNSNQTGDDLDANIMSPRYCTIRAIQVE